MATLNSSIGNTTFSSVKISESFKIVEIEECYSTSITSLYGYKTLISRPPQIPEYISSVG